MLKFTGDGRNGKVFFLGLSRANVIALMAGRPIKVDLRDMGGPPIEIAILFGETEKLLFDELRKAGLINSDIEYRDTDPHMVEIVRVMDGSSQVSSEGASPEMRSLPGKASEET